MIYEKLLEAVKDNPTTRAVVELHKPSPLGKDTCWHCEGWYPCATIDAITNHL